MLKLISLTFLQSLLLVTSQLLLKKALIAFGPFRWTFSYFREVFTNLWFAFSGLTAVTAIILWMMILKKYEFSLAYPLTSVSYLIGLLASVFVLGEAVPVSRWIGVVILIVGVYFIVK